MSIPDVRLGRATPLPAPQHNTTHAPGSGSRFAEMAAARTPTQPAQVPQPASATPGAEGPHSAVRPEGAAVAGAQHTDPSANALTDAGRRILARVARGERYIEQVVRGAAGGKAYTPADLLAIQAQVYRHTQEVELVSKFVDRATTTVKTVLQQGGS